MFYFKIFVILLAKLVFAHQSLLFENFFVLVSNLRSVSNLRTISNIYDEAILRKQLTAKRLNGSEYVYESNFLKFSIQCR